MMFRQLLTHVLVYIYTETTVNLSGNLVCALCHHYRYMYMEIILVASYDGILSIFTLVPNILFFNANGGQLCRSSNVSDLLAWLPVYARA